MGRFALVDQYLSLYLYDNATFLCERLHAEAPSDESVGHLSACYLRQGRPKRAYALLQGAPPSSPHNRYLLALACFKLNKLHEAEGALLHDRRLRTRGPLKSQAQLLAKRANRRKQAIEYYELSLKLDPLMWVSFEALCNLGADVNADSFFGEGGAPGLSAASAAAGASFQTPGIHLNEDGSVGDYSAGTLASFGTPGSEIDADQARGAYDYDDPLTGARAPSAPADSRGERQIDSASLATSLDGADDSRDVSVVDTSRGTGFGMPATSLLFNTPALTPILPNTTPRPSGGAAGADDVAPRDDVDGALDDDDDASAQPTSAVPMSSADATSQSLRKGSRLSFSSMADEKPAKLQRGHVHGTFSSAADAQANGAQHAAAPAPADAAAGDRPASTRARHHVSRSQLVRPMLAILRILGSAYQSLCQYKCKEALQILHQLSPQQFETGWVQHQVGRAYFEMADYVNSKRALEAMQQAEPHRMAGLEILSTALWHLKEEVELCYLAQLVSEFDKHAPEVWCVVGNCFSLQKEHETALKFFQRATQVEPEFTYAYTLCGHEYVANEDFEKAICMYRHAIKTDERHYNAWYGLGAIYYRQEKFELAEYHFRRALSINAQSSVLHCYLGMVLHANKKCEEALDLLHEASAMEPKNPQARFQRANVLITMEQYEAALVELEAVRDYAPKESSVHFLMGKVCKKLERLDEAMMHFTFALDLNPKDNNMTKNAIDRLEQPDISEDETW